VVRILGQKERSSILKKLKSSSSSSTTKHTAQGIPPPTLREPTQGLLGLLQARCMADLLEVFLDGIVIHLAEVAKHISPPLS